MHVEIESLDRFHRDSGVPCIKCHLSLPCKQSFGVIDFDDSFWSARYDDIIGVTTVL